MPRPDALHCSAQPLLPAGHRWGTGVESLVPYLRDAWALRTRNPVFTPAQAASIAWPAKAARPGSRGKSSSSSK